MKIALISGRPALGDKKSNIKKMENYIDQTKADMYVFGEMFLTGYPCKDEFKNLAESLNGDSIKYMKKVAKKNNCYIVFGLPLKDEHVKGLIYNSAVLIHPKGTVDHYNKRFLINFGPFEEKIYFDEGEQANVFDTKFGKIGLFICYDLYFPEITRALCLQGADLLICVSASPSTTRKFFETLLPARALENTTFVAYSNIVGTQEELVLWGGSQLFDPLGNLLIKAPYFKESIITYDISIDDVESARANRPVLRDVRPELYQDLYSLSRYHRRESKKN